MNRSVAGTISWNASVSLTVFGIGVFGYLLNTTNWFTMIPGDLGDPRFNSVILEHLYQWATGAIDKLWHPQFFYPFQWVLAFSDNHFGSAWSYIAFRLFGLPREEAYLGWFLCGSVLSFWACWYALKQLRFSTISAAFGSFVFAFSLPVLHQESHAQLVYRFAVPLAFAAWHRVLTVQDGRALIHTILWCGLQFLCSIYVGIFLMYLLAAMLISYWLAKLLTFIRVDSGVFTFSRWRRALSRWRGRWWFAPWSVTSALVAICALCVLVLTLMMLRRYQIVSHVYGFDRPLDIVASMLPRLGSYLLADHSALTGWIGAGVAQTSVRTEQQMFAGLGVCSVMLMTLVYVMTSQSKRSLTFASRHVILQAIWALLLLVIGSLYVYDSSIYLTLAEAAPGVRAVRVVSRIILVMLMPIAVVVAAGVDLATKQFGITFAKRFLLVSLFLAMITLETIYYQPDHTAIHAWRDRRDALEARIKYPLAQDAILFVTPLDGQPFFMTEIDAMIYAQDHKRATINGYSGNFPPGYAYLDTCSVPQARIDGYLVFMTNRGRGLPIDRQSLLKRLHLIELAPCANFR